LVRGLQEPESADYLALLLGRRPPPDQARKLHAKTGGNPLFLRELSACLESNAAADASAIDQAPGFEPPEIVRYVLGRRVARLGERVHQVLEAAAVLGMEWDVFSLERMTGCERGLVLSALDAAASQRIVVALARVETYRFSSDLLRETLLAELATSARKRLHLLAASTCEARLSWRGPEGVREIALHLYHALPDGDAGVTVGWLTRAAELAENAADREDAELLYRHALDATRFLAQPDHALQRRLGRAIAALRGRADLRGRPFSS
jgi:predicted ATPase